jgi:hypothetical protein
MNQNRNKTSKKTAQNKQKKGRHDWFFFQPVQQCNALVDARNSPALGTASPTREQPGGYSEHS